MAPEGRTGLTRRRERGVGRSGLKGAAFRDGALDIFGALLLLRGRRSTAACGGRSYERSLYSGRFSSNSIFVPGDR